MRARAPICTLHYELDIDAAALPVVLSLLDQLYETRQNLLSLTAAIRAQDDTVQAAIMAALRPEGETRKKKRADFRCFVAHPPHPPPVGGSNRCKRFGEGVSATVKLRVSCYAPSSLAHPPRKILHCV